MPPKTTPNRGAKKDFFDLHMLIERFGLEKPIDHYRAKFPETDPMMLLRSLSYFADAEAGEDPQVLDDLTWGDVKDSIRQAVRAALEA